MEQTDRTILIVVAVLIIVACCCMALVAGAVAFGRLGSNIIRTTSDWGTIEASDTIRQSFAVDEPVTLTVDVPVGSIDVQAGTADSVEVEATITAYGSSQARAREILDEVRFDATQSRSNVLVRATWSQPLTLGGRSPKVDLRITVPTRTETNLNLDVGEIRLAGTEGDVDIQADVGQVTVRDVVVLDNLEIDTDVAEIQFRSALSDGADYEFASDVGAIVLVLPADSQFQLDASSDVGAVMVAFDVVGEESRDLVGKEVKGTVNGGGDTTVTARSNVGAVTVRQE